MELFPPLAPSFPPLFIGIVVRQNILHYTVTTLSVAVEPGLVFQCCIISPHCLEGSSKALLCVEQVMRGVLSHCSPPLPPTFSFSTAILLGGLAFKYSTVKLFVRTLIKRKSFSNKQGNRWFSFPQHNEVKSFVREE